jgi:hypothetical protein
MPLHRFLLIVCPQRPLAVVMLQADLAIGLTQ